MSNVNPIAPNCNTVNAYLIVKDAEKAMELYKAAFGGSGGSCLTMPDGTVLHAEIVIGDSTIMISEENEQWGMVSAETLGGSPASLMLYVEDCDAIYQQAISAGMKEVSPPADQFWGDRHGKVADPFGFEWGIATHIEDLTEEEMQKRGQEWLAQMMSHSQGAN